MRCAKTAEPIEMTFGARRIKFAAGRPHPPLEEALFVIAIVGHGQISVMCGRYSQRYSQGNSGDADFGYRYRHNLLLLFLVTVTELFVLRRVLDTEAASQSNHQSSLFFIHQ